MKNLPFSSFTNLFALSKTIRFELLPVGETLQNIEKNGVIAADKAKQENYKLVKPLLDDLHHRFISESLAASDIVWEGYYDEYVRFREEKDRESKWKIKRNILEKLEATLRANVAMLFDETANLWKKKYFNEKGESLLKETGYKILTEKNILLLLERIHADNPTNLSAIKSFDGFFTYFSGFNINRENYYSSLDKETAVSYRIVNENLQKFCANTYDYAMFLKGKLQITETEESALNIKGFNKYLNQSGIDAYNKIIGGFVNEKGEKVQGINEKINLYNQVRGDAPAIPQLKRLFKQIGAPGQSSTIFSIDEEENTLEKVLKLFIQKSKIVNNQAAKLFNHTFSANSLDGIYLNERAINTISSKWFVSWDTFRRILGGLNTENEEKINDYRLPKQIKLIEILEALKKDVALPENVFKDTFKSLYIEKDKAEIFLAILKQELIGTGLEGEKNGEHVLKIIEDLDLENQAHKTLIKDFADNALALLQMLKYFIVSESKVEVTNASFYNELSLILEDYLCFEWYNAIRNHLTKKPFNSNKLKLNFNCATLLAGWDITKESSNLSVILKDGNGSQYLAIADKKHNFIFDKKRNSELYLSENNEGAWQKMDFKLLPGPNKMLPKVIFANGNREIFQISNEILKIRERESFKKSSPTFDKDDLKKWIDFCITNINLYPAWKEFDFKFQPAEKYEDVSRFYNEVEKQGYKLDFVPISTEYLFKMLSEGKIYLFKINNKDLKSSENVANKKLNLHTYYWQKLFEANQSVLKLNGEAEIFYREKSLSDDDAVITKGNSRRIEHAQKLNRYKTNKFFFHVPLTLNYAARQLKFNEKINEYLKSNINEVNVIGIDRGEKHLAYYSVVNRKGEIIEQGSLNKDPQGKDYELILSERAAQRDKARKDWDTIGKIKDLKEGYISQVVHKLVDLILKYNAVIVLEDLNTGFKRGRQKIEKSVYQKLEVALAKKLNYVVIKNREDNLPGSVLKAFQLTPPTNLFSDIRGKQHGIMLYTRAAFTSVTDPITGFHKNIFLYKGSSHEMKRQLEVFSEIGYDEGNKAYFFSYRTKQSTDKNWTIWSCVDRLVNKKNEKGVWETVSVNPTENLNKLFVQYGFDLTEELINQIKKMPDLENSFFETLIWNINIILQLRNSNSEKGIDFIHSPIKNADGKQFDSRDSEKTGGLLMPDNGDANGAYNIARKGILMLNRIVEKPQKPDLFISDQIWDEAVQDWWI